MHPVTLRFERALEAEFATEYFDRTLTQVRIALLLAFFLYVVFGVLDLFIAPNQRRELWLIRYAVVAPLLLACFGFTYARAFRRFREDALFVTILIAALGIVAMTFIIPAPGSYLYYAGLLLAIMYVFTLIRLNVMYSTSLSLLVVAAYLEVALHLNPTPAVLIVNNMFFMISTIIIGFMANYSMERYARTNFLQRRLIHRRTRELEDKNAELVTKNQMLAESRATTLRTAHRSELLFAALSEALPGTLLDDKYRVGEKIGSGTFGTVYRGEHVLLHHPVAIKVFRPAIGSFALDSIDRFRLEGISACRIDHPNAVTVLDFGVSPESLAYLVMELLQGRSLADELRACRAVPANRCARVSAAVCDALAAAHAASIVHRDIKPSNIFLHLTRGEEVVKVIDFGIAKLTTESTDPDIQATTVAGTLLGSPAYMAPERLLGEPYDGRADVYAVGVMMYEMVTGNLPFAIDQGGTYLSAALAQATKIAETRLALDAPVPASFKSIVLRALSPDQRDRPTAVELAAEVRQFV